MKNAIKIISAAILIAFTSCQQADEWTDLINGEDLVGWEVKGAEESNFFYEDGVLMMETKMGLPNTFLVTKIHYANFELEAEFKVNKGMNTGIQLRSSNYEEETTTPYLDGNLNQVERTWQAGRVNGYQIEIDPSDRRWTGGFYEEGGRGWLVPLDKNEEARNAYKSEDWNHLRILADGNHFQTWINGIQAVDTHDDKASHGFIGLQLHSIKSEEQLGLRTVWKSVRIKELD